jgi:hypothetical protein
MPAPLLILSALILFPLISLSQEETSERTCRIIFLSAPKESPSSLHLYDGHESQEVLLPRRNFSPVYKLPTGPITLHLLPSPATTPEELTDGAPSVDVPETMKDIYLIVTSDPSNQIASVQIQVIDASFERVKKGEMLWINLTNLTCYGNVGASKLYINPKQGKILKKPAQERSVYPVKIHYNREGSTHIHTLCDMKWRHNPQGRSLIFIVEKGKPRGAHIIGFNDFRLETSKDNVSQATSSDE